MSDEQFVRPRVVSDFVLFHSSGVAKFSVCGGGWSVGIASVGSIVVQWWWRRRAWKLREADAVPTLPARGPTFPCSAVAFPWIAILATFVSV